MPFAAAQPWFKLNPNLQWYQQWQNIFVFFYIALSVVIIWLTARYVQKGGVGVALYYGLGIAYLLFPAMLCIFVTPIFARLLYVPGAIFLFLAFRQEAKTLEAGV